MTTHESYVFGWVFGRINTGRATPIGGNFGEAAMRPYSGLARVMQDARRLHLMTPELDAEIAAALDGIDRDAPEMDGPAEKVQPLENQGAWQMGYYSGYGKHPVTDKGDAST